MTILFEVEQAGCESCGRLISAALSEVGTVESITINESADIASVELSGPASRAAVEAALAQASSKGGHAYRLRPESWLPRS